MLLQIGTVRFDSKDLMAFHPTDAGLIGKDHVEGFFINLILRGAPAPIKAGCRSENEREMVLGRLEALWKSSRRSQGIKNLNP